jgi:hypothetical protein
VSTRYKPKESLVGMLWDGWCPVCQERHTSITMMALNIEGNWECMVCHLQIKLNVDGSALVLEQNGCNEFLGEGHIRYLASEALTGDYPEIKQDLKHYKWDTHKLRRCS